ncbi:MAG: polyribonucleotide nucleotidyltransferase [Ignavibacteria bacterium]|nr:MAG: polyribonucleotide nucleotidyltransferase [Ignavibacteria bacterium]
MNYVKEIEVGGKKLTIESGKYARQANGAVMISVGGTQVLVTATAAGEPKEDLDFLPLSVEYRERSAAAGKIPGGFFKREGRPSEKEILSARLIDRPIRPLFPKNYRHETQVAAFVYSFDGENDPDVIAAIGASAALAISNIPFLEPIGEVRVVRVDGKYIVNPVIAETEQADLELVVAGTADSIMMVEGEAKEVSEAEFLEALKAAHEEIKKIVAMQNEMISEIGQEKLVVEEPSYPDGLVDAVNKLAFDKMKEVVHTVLPKQERSQKNKELVQEVLEQLEEEYPECEKEIKEILHDMEKDLMRKMILDEGKRLDGRSTTEIRPITIELGVLARTHGSALFTRGETQSLTTLTLGSKSDEQIIDGLQEEYKKRFILHYNFPPFSVGETGRYGTPGRREIGHGNLAERALKFVVPKEADFPYTLRLNSDILESNGSSSMATVCAGSLAMFDGGVPCKSAIAGIAMGLIKEDDQYAILSDISGNEDHLGDMDFKVAGSDIGITAIQMDIKIQGISYEIMEKALAQAKDGRLHILGLMNQAMPEPREKISPYAPTLINISINPEKIGAVIGPGGKVIQKIQKDYGVVIYIEDDGSVNIAGQNAESTEAAKDLIVAMTSEPEVGKVYNGKVVKIADFGAFVEIMPGTQGLLHISQIDNSRVNKVTDFLKEGDLVEVKLMKIENGKLSLSRKALLQKDKSEKSDKKED